MDIKNSRRILAVGAPDSGVLDIIKDLTGSLPTLNENGSTAGIAHEWNVETEYYTAKVPIWMDEVTDVEAWKAEFSKSEAKEVVEAVGAWVYCFRKPQNGTPSAEVEGTMKAIQEVLEEHAGYGADVVMLAVAVPKTKAVANDGDSDQAAWDDMCMQYGFEYVDYSATGTNEFGEKTGFERLKEALEANEWTASSGDDDADLDMDDLDFDTEGDMNSFARDEAEMTAELFGLKSSLVGDDFDPDVDEFVLPNQQADNVETLDRLMGRLLAVKERSADLPEAQRKRLVAQAVRDLMQEDSA